MGATLVVAGEPSGDHGSGMIEVVEDRLVQEFIAHPAVEGFTDSVLHGLARGNEVPRHGNPPVLNGALS